MNCRQCGLAIEPRQKHFDGFHEACTPAKVTPRLRARKGGLARKANLPDERLREIAAQAARARNASMTPAQRREIARKAGLASAAKRAAKRELDRAATLAKAMVTVLETLKGDTAHAKRVLGVS